MPEENGFFARRLVELREKAGFSQYELAKRAGLSRQALSLLELGSREPGWLTVQRLAAALGVSCETFTDPSVQPTTPAPPPRRGRPPKAAGDAPAKKKGKKGG